MEERTRRYAQTLRRMIREETVSVPGEDRTGLFRSFHKLLAQLFPHLFSACEQEEFHGSLLLRWPGREGETPPVCFLNHMDVVEAPGQWEHPPFAGEEAGGKLWGRGTLDDKGGLWAMLQAAEELAGSGFVPARDLYFVSTCTEETDGSGAREITEALRSRGIRFAMTFDEGGMVMYDPIGGAKGTFAMVGVGEKGCSDLKFTARSAGGHASTPGRDTPLVRLGKFMAEMERRAPFQTEISPPVAEMLRRFAPYMGAAGGAAGRPEAFGWLLKRVLPALSPTAGALLHTTLAFTMARGSEGTNVLPQEAWVIGNMRFSHHQGRDASVGAVRAIAEKYKIEVEVLDEGVCSRITDYRGDAFRLVDRAIRAALPQVDETVPYIMTGASDSRFFDALCGQCIRFLPFQIDGQQLSSVHGLNENIDLSALAPAVDYYRFLMREV